MPEPFLIEKKCSESAKKNKNCGGYRKGCGRGKAGWYKNIWCDSSWELAYVIYCLEHRIYIKRNTEKFKYFFNNEYHFYLPDFIDKNKNLIEIKGYSSKKWEAKLKYFPKNRKLIIINAKSIEKYLNYVIKKYGIDFINLYEKNINRKPTKKMLNKVKVIKKREEKQKATKTKKLIKSLQKVLVFELNKKILQQTVKKYKPKYGVVTKIAKDLNISHTQVRRLAKKYNINIYSRK